MIEYLLSLKHWFRNQEEEEMWHSYYLRDLRSTSEDEIEMAYRSLHNTLHNASLNDSILTSIYLGSKSLLYFQSSHCEYECFYLWNMLAVLNTLVTEVI